MIKQLWIGPVQRGATPFLCLGLLLLPGVASRGADTGQSAARSLSEAGLLLSRLKPGDQWQVIPPERSLTGGELLIGLTGAQLDSENGSVRLTFIGNLGGQ